jgi:RNA polymerase sigma factor (sigma-70 family)
MLRPDGRDAREDNNSDAALARRMAGGDVSTLGLLFDRYFDEIYRIALYGTAGDAETAKDLSQETFLECARTIGRFRGPSLRNWLAGILRNLLARYWRKSARVNRHLGSGDMTSLLREQIDKAELPEDVLSNKEAGVLLQRGLAEIEPNHSEVLVKRYMEGRSVAELASELKITEAGVHSLLFRARQALRDALKNVATDYL